MPSSQVFGVNNSGRVHTLLTDEQHWQELDYLGIEFKKVSAHELVVWALGGDHQIYVYVYGTTVPIRVCEEAYENQRWRPTEGFSHHLLPTDRAVFSAADGLTERTLMTVHLPTLAWTWEGPWVIHTTLAGQPLTAEGWMYAVDFPRAYHATSSWSSCVRRRKWTRYRRYVALHTWSAVPSIHHDYTQEPFIDIAVGGGEVAGGEADVLMVWGVTALGKVMVRVGVSGQSPEGDRWVHVPTPPNHDPTSLGVGRSGRVWAVTWEGRLLVRNGVSRDCSNGVSWEVVDHPPHCPIVTVGVGLNVVWALGRDHSVWFRRGLAPANSGRGGGGVGDAEALVGIVWLKMVGQLLREVSVGPDEQVMGVTSADYSVVVRTGVTCTELTGRTWRLVDVPVVAFDAADGAAATDDSGGGAGEDDSSSEASSAIMDVSGAIEGLENSITSNDKAMTALCQEWDDQEKEIFKVADLQDEQMQDSLRRQKELQAGDLTQDELQDDGSEQNVPSDDMEQAMISFELEVKEKSGSSVRSANNLVDDECKHSMTTNEGDDECDDDETFESATDDSDGDNIYQSSLELVDGVCASKITGRRKRKKVKSKKKEKEKLNFETTENESSHADLDYLKSGNTEQGSEQSAISKSKQNENFSAIVTTESHSSTHHSSNKSQSSSPETTIHQHSKCRILPQNSFTLINQPPFQQATHHSTSPHATSQQPTHHSASPHATSQQTKTRSRQASGSSSSGGDSTSTALQQATALGLRGATAAAASDGDGGLPHLVEKLWLGVAAGGCWLHPVHMPNWFSGGGDNSGGASWRENIGQQLREQKAKLLPFRGVYREVVHSGSWTMSGRCRWLLAGHWLPATILLTFTHHRAHHIDDDVGDDDDDHRTTNDDVAPGSDFAPAGGDVTISGSDGGVSLNTTVCNAEDSVDLNATNSTTVTSAGVGGSIDDTISSQHSHEEERDLDIGAVLVIEFTSNTKRTFSISLSSILLARIYINTPARCLLALYSLGRPQDPYCLLFGQETAVEEWADNLSGAIWQHSQWVSTQHRIKQLALRKEIRTAVKQSGHVSKSSSAMDLVNSKEEKENDESESLECELKSLPYKRPDRLKYRPSPNIIWATTVEGSVYFHDCATQLTKALRSNSALKFGQPREQRILPVRQRLRQFLYALPQSGFTEGAVIALTFIIDRLAPDKFHVNLQCGSSAHCAVALHCNPRLKKKMVVMNSFDAGVWQTEERHKLPGSFKPGAKCSLQFVCGSGDYKIAVDGRAWHTFNHRFSPTSITHVLVDGNITLTSMIYSPPAQAIPSPKVMAWEAMGGHVVRVAAGTGGVTWALSNDCHVYTWTGGRGGGCYKTVSSLCSYPSSGSNENGSTSSRAPLQLLHPHSDVVHDYLWENQRWNPLTGFNARGLPTDRPAWTQHGRPTQHKTKDQVKLPSRHWMWTSEWSVDYHTVGGVDGEGWQHATDYPLSYHAHCYVTDLVRRRRWKRRRRLNTTGPWTQLGRTPLVFVDVAACAAADGSTPVWGITVNGEVLMRTGVTPDKPEGVDWLMVGADCPVAGVCVDMGECDVDVAIEFDDLEDIADNVESNEMVSSSIGSSASGDSFSSDRKQSKGIHYVTMKQSLATASANMVKIVAGTSNIDIQAKDSKNTNKSSTVKTHSLSGYKRSGKSGLSFNNCQVWAVTRDGRAMVRIGVTATNPSGIQWADVDAPGVPLRKVEVGGGSVWGLDEQGGLYKRVDTQPLFPEGTSWSFVCGGVVDHSVGSNGDVWAVVNSGTTTSGEAAKVEGNDGNGTSLLGRRIGITNEVPIGTGWEFVAGTAWATVNAKMICNVE